MQPMWFVLVTFFPFDKLTIFIQRIYLQKKNGSKLKTINQHYQKHFKKFVHDLKNKKIQAQYLDFQNSAFLCYRTKNLYFEMIVISRIFYAEV